MIKKFAFACSLVAAMLVLTSAKSNKSVVKYDEAVQDIIKEYNCVGLQTAVVKEGKIVFTKAYGVKDLESGEAMTTSNIFKVGLCGRVVVPIAIFQLVENKMISLKDDVSKYLGFELRNPSYPDIPITIQHLLRQVSTLTDADEFKSIDNLRSTDPAFASLWADGKQPGKDYCKCNSGFVVLAAIVEKVTGERFDEYAQKYIFGPLHIKASYTPTDFTDGDFVKSYTYSNGEYVHYKKMYRVYNRENYVPGVSTFKLRVKNDLMISAEDLSKIILTLANNGHCPLYKVALFSEETAERFLKPVKSQKRCSGINTSAKYVEGAIIYNSTGAWGGTTGMWAFDRDTKTGFVIMTNGTAKEGFNTSAREAFIESFF